MYNETLSKNCLEVTIERVRYMQLISPLSNSEFKLAGKQFHICDIWDSHNSVDGTYNSSKILRRVECYNVSEILLSSETSVIIYQSTSNK